MSITAEQRTLIETFLESNMAIVTQYLSPEEVVNFCESYCDDNQDNASLLSHIQHLLAKRTKNIDDHPLTVATKHLCTLRNEVRHRPALRGSMRELVDNYFQGRAVIILVEQNLTILEREAQIFSRQDDELCSNIRKLIEERAKDRQIETKELILHGRDVKADITDVREYIITTYEHERDEAKAALEALQQELQELHNRKHTLRRHEREEIEKQTHILQEQLQHLHQEKKLLRDYERREIERQEALLQEHMQTLFSQKQEVKKFEKSLLIEQEAELAEYLQEEFELQMDENRELREERKALAEEAYAKKQAEYQQARAMAEADKALRKEKIQHHLAKEQEARKARREKLKADEETLKKALEARFMELQALREERRANTQQQVEYHKERSLPKGHITHYQKDPEDKKPAQQPIAGTITIGDKIARKKRELLNKQKQMEAAAIVHKRNLEAHHEQLSRIHRQHEQELESMEKRRKLEAQQKHNALEREKEEKKKTHIPTVTHYHKEEDKQRTHDALEHQLSEQFTQEQRRRDMFAEEQRKIQESITKQKADIVKDLESEGQRYQKERARLAHAADEQKKRAESDTQAFEHTLKENQQKLQKRLDERKARVAALQQKRKEREAKKGEPPKD